MPSAERCHPSHKPQATISHHRHQSSSSDRATRETRAITSHRTVDGLTKDRRILFFLTYLSGRQTWYQNEPADSGWVDEGQTNSVLFDLGICLAVKRGKYPNEPADSGWVDEGQTNSVLFDLSVWPWAGPSCLDLIPSYSYRLGSILSVRHPTSPMNSLRIIQSQSIIVGLSPFLAEVTSLLVYYVVGRSLFSFHDDDCTPPLHHASKESSSPLYLLYQ